MSLSILDFGFWNALRLNRQKTAFNGAGIGEGGNREKVQRRIVSDERFDRLQN